MIACDCFPPNARPRLGQLGFVLALLSAAWTSKAFGQANYESALIGGRSALMGGTGVAAGKDSAAALQNPASTVGIEGTSFAFSTFFIQLTSRWVAPRQDQLPEVDLQRAQFDQTELRVLPNSTCLFFDLRKVPNQRRGHHKGNICFAEPENQSFELGTTVLAESVNGRGGFQQRFVAQVYSKKVYSVGWAASLSEHLSIGVNPMLEEVGYKDIEGIQTVVTGDSALADAIGEGGQSLSNIITGRAGAFALSVLGGVQWRLSDDFVLGASLQSPSLHVTGSYEGHRSSEAVSSPVEQYVQEKGSARFTYPTRLALGIAGKVQGVTFEVDGYFHGGRDDFAVVSATRQFVTVDDGIITEAASEPALYQEGLRPVVNVGVGAEIPLSSTWAIVTGLLTDISGLRPRQNGSSLDSTIFRNRLDAVHGSVGVAWTPRAGSVLMGMRGFYGEGEMAITDPRQVPPLRIAAPQAQWGLSFVLSGQLTLELLAEADPTGLVKKAAAPKPPAPKSPKAAN